MIVMKIMKYESINHTFSSSRSLMAGEPPTAGLAAAETEGRGEFLVGVPGVVMVAEGCLRVSTKSFSMKERSFLRLVGALPEMSFWPLGPRRETALR